jgi:hypothetical protein
MLQPLASGELLYVTNDQKLYVGDGTTLGGIQITGYTDGDAKDSAAEIFTDGSHNSITFSYNTATNVMTTSVDLSNYAGTIRADAFKGSLFADDGSTIASQPLVDAISGTFNGNLVGNVTGNVTGNITGNVTGNVTGNLVGNSTGYHFGDVKGSIFGDDSTTIINSVDNTIFAAEYSTSFLTISDSSIISSSTAPVGTQSDNPIYFGDTEFPNTLWVTSDNNFGIFTGLTDGTNNAGLQFNVSRGTLDTPTTLLAGDGVAVLNANSYNGSAYVPVGIMGLFADEAWNGTPGSSGEVPGQFGALVLDIAGNPKQFSFNSSGVLTAPIFKAAGYATGSLPTSPEEGWMVFDSTTKEFKGWNGTTWVVLG